MKKIIIIIFCVNLFAQPKPFDPNYYKDSLKVKNPEEFKKLEEYREKYEKLGYRNDGSYSDLFFYKRIDLDKIINYKETINIESILDLPLNIYSEYFNQIIVVGKLITFRRGNRYYDATFEIVNVIRGKEFYDNFPDTIECHSYIGSGYVEVDRTNGKTTEYEVYFEKVGPTPGDEYIIFLDKHIKEDVFGQNEIINNDFYEKNVFYHARGKYFDRNNLESKKQLYDNILDNINRIDELNLK